MCCLAVVNDVECEYRPTEEHGLNKRWVCSAGTVPMNIAFCILAQCVEYIQIIYAVEQHYIVVAAVLIFELLAVAVMLPVAYEYEFLFAFRECLQCQVAVVLGLNAAKAHVVFILF